LSFDDEDDEVDDDDDDVDHSLEKGLRSLNCRNGAVLLLPPALACPKVGQREESGCDIAFRHSGRSTVLPLSGIALLPPRCIAKPSSGSGGTMMRIAIHNRVFNILCSLIAVYVTGLLGWQQRLIVVV
jgi:hypothetical protein